MNLATVLFITQENGLQVVEVPVKDDANSRKVHDAVYSTARELKIDCGVITLYAEVTSVSP